MEIHVTLTGRGDLSARIYRQLLEAILDGRLRAGERLPPTRELARRLQVSRNTVAVAYERLTAEGFVTGRVGAGTFVSLDPFAGTRPGARTSGGPGREAPPGDIAPRPVWRSIPVWPERRDEALPYDFKLGVPDGTLFPLESWRRLIARRLRSSALADAGYADPAGHPGLRTAIARHFGISRSVRAGADDVLVTQGAQQALDLVGRVLIEPGDQVAVEDPGYPPARLLFRSLGARVVAVPVDEEGIDVAAIPAAARLVYVTPSHQFPLGTPMSPTRRAALLEWAERRGAAVIEDDYDSEFRFSDRPLEPLQSLDRCGRVIYVGSFSKSTLPMLRLGFLVAPASLRPALLAAKRLTDWHGQYPQQAAMADLIDEGLLARHIRKAGRVYAARHRRILDVLRRDFAGRLDPIPSAAGLHLCARLAPGAAIDLDEVIARARELGVGVHSVSGFHAEGGPHRPGLVLGYGGIPLERIDEGLRRLAAAFDAVAGPGSGAAPEVVTV